MTHTPERTSRVESESAVAGYLDKYLSQINLPGYTDILDRQGLHIQPDHLAQEIDTITTALLPNEPSKEEIRLYGDKPRYIASGQNMDLRYWTVAEKRLADGYFWDPDLDIMVKGQSIDTVLERLLHNLSIDDPGTEVYGRTQYTYAGTYFDINISIGTIPTVNIRNIVVSFYPKNNSSDTHRIYHLDISEQTEKPIVVAREKRKGSTFSWQDFGYAQLTKQNGHTFYTVDKDALRWLHRPIEIYAYARTSYDMLEHILRATRMSCMHPLNQIKLSDGQVLSLINFDMFAPQMWSPTILDEHDGSRITISRLFSDIVPDANLKLLVDDLDTSLRFDPFLTVLALRSTGASRLIPALAKLTPSDWEAILKSDRFSFKLGAMEQPVPQKDRTNQYLIAQRDLYMKTNRIDGTELFLLALQDAGHIPYGHTPPTLRSLWENRIDFQQLPDFKPEKGMISFKIGQLVLTGPKGNFSSMKIITDSIKMLLDDLLDIRDPKKRILLAQNMLLGHMPGTAIYIENNKMKQRDPQKAKGILNRSMRNIGILFDCVLREKYGLTPREIHRFTESFYRAHYDEKTFQHYLFLLKSTGKIQVQTLTRLDSKRQLVTIDLLYPVHGASRPLANISDKFVEKLHTDDTEKLNKVKQNILLWLSLGIPTYEALTSLRTKDFEYIISRYPNRNYTVPYLENAQKAVLSTYDIYEEQSNSM